ncbi:MAG: hypothetical protein K8T91_04085 [Planctomycetes bacterium]|nr:hypothetical protein [Planctomycetota bacterium]
MWVRRGILRRRIRALARVARRLEIQFEMKGGLYGIDKPHPPELKIDHPGHFLHAELLLSGVVDGLSVELVQYDFFAGNVDVNPSIKLLRNAGLLTGQDMNENTQMRYCQYVLRPQSTNRALPDFQLTPIDSPLLKSQVHRLGASSVQFGHEPTHDSFLHKYRLFSRHAGSVRQIFTMQFQRDLLAAFPCAVQCRQGELVIWTRTWQMYNITLFPHDAAVLEAEIRRMAFILKSLLGTSALPAADREGDSGA